MTNPFHPFSTALSLCFHVGWPPAQAGFLSAEIPSSPLEREFLSPIIPVEVPKLSLIGWSLAHPSATFSLVSCSHMPILEPGTWASSPKESLGTVSRRGDGYGKLQMSTLPGHTHLLTRPQAPMLGHLWMPPLSLANPHSFFWAQFI